MWCQALHQDIIDVLYSFAFIILPVCRRIVFYIIRFRLFSNPQAPLPPDILPAPSRMTGSVSAEQPHVSSEVEWQDVSLETIGGCTRDSAELCANPRKATTTNIDQKTVS